ncbi:AAA family ATPase [uncultured Methanospirillum sp.]|uniref:AAA family ATPase n=1 Tax=uncultured Methanospirillum sp. TaxID=262503 RepID=UPI0029C8CC3B|nr:AAA family ATPase [uncultured Methanospirillum sp.]
MTLTIKIQNVGPYQEAEIPIHPLTILTGPENSDYFYLLRFLHTIYRLHEMYISYIPDLRRSPKVKRDPTPAVIDLIGKTALEEIYNQNLMNLLESYFGVKTSDLRLQKSILGHVYLTSEQARTHLVTDDAESLICFESECPLPAGLFAKGPKDLPRPGQSTTAFTPVIRGVIGNWVAFISEGCPPHSLYLPNNRVEIINAYDREIDPAKNSPLIIELINELDGFFVSKERYNPDPWREEEMTLINGESRLIVHPDGSYEIVVRKGDTDLPPDALPPECTSLIPIFLSLKYRRVTGDVFIIEEPELHLNQEQQIHLARLFTKMVKAGYRIIIGTRSSVIIDEIKRIISGNQSSSDLGDPICADDVTLCIEEKMVWGRGLHPVDLR